MAFSVYCMHTSGTGARELAINSHCKWPSSHCVTDMGMFLFAFWVISTSKCEVINFSSQQLACMNAGPISRNVPYQYCVGIPNLLVCTMSALFALHTDKLSSTSQTHNSMTN